MPTTCETTSAVARQFHSDETTLGTGFTVETLRVATAEYDAYRREDGRDHSNLAINGIVAAKVWEFSTGTIHIDVRDGDGTGHTIALRSATDVEAIISLLSDALANRAVLS